jgi:hypothetical protein
LPTSDVAGPSGYPLPVRPRRSQTTRPIRSSCHQPCPRMRLRRRSSPAVQRSFTVCPDRPRLTSLDARHLSWGSVSLQRIQVGRVHVRSGCPARFRRQVPPRRLRCRSQVFSTSQRLLPLLAVPPFSGGWRSWDSPFRELFLTRSPDDSSSPASPHDVPPAGLEPPILGRGIRR